MCFIQRICILIQNHYHSYRFGTSETVDAFKKDRNLIWDGRYQRFYDGTSSRLKIERFFTSPIHYYRKDYEYYAAGTSHQFLLKSEKIVDSNDPTGFELRWINAYQFNQPSQIDMPDGREVDIFRTIRFDGVIENETQYGVTTHYEYDKDSRVKKVSIQGVKDFIEYQYSSPDRDTSAPQINSLPIPTDRPTNIWQMQHDGKN